VSLGSHADCPRCGVEGARVADDEAAHCRICAEGMPATESELGRVLAIWAVEEGFESANELVESSFLLGSTAAVLDALLRKEPVETSFDGIEYLFAGRHGGGAGEPAEVADEPSAPEAPEGHEPARGEAHELPRRAFNDPWTSSAPASQHAPFSLRPMAGGPYDELLALASVAAADGEPTSLDRELLALAATARGLPPLPLEDIRVRRPNEIAAPPTLPDRERLLEEMFRLAWSNEELDESEVRVVREFARAWGVDPQRISEWTAVVQSDGKSKVARWIDRVGYFLFPGW
jgi:hypothetical protein